LPKNRLPTKRSGLGAARYVDEDGRLWRKLSVRELLADPEFMNIGL
jgi:twitching motility protein PilI